MRKDYITDAHNCPQISEPQGLLTQLTKNSNYVSSVKNLKKHRVAWNYVCIIIKKESDICMFFWL